MATSPESHDMSPSDLQPAASKSTAADTPRDGLRQENPETLATLTLNSSINEVPLDIADSSSFPKVLRRTSTVASGAIDLHANKKHERDPHENSGARSTKETDKREALEIFQEFEPHYDMLQGSVRVVLQSLLDDMAINKSIHTWDHKLFVSPLRQLEKDVRHFLSEQADTDMSGLLLGVAVEAIARAHGSTMRKSPLQGDVPGTLFFSKITPLKDAESATQGHSKQASASIPVSARDKGHNGRIILVKEHVPAGERAALLLLLSMCIRLQNEDYAYIQAFIERHLLSRSKFSWPLHLQRMSPPQMSSSEQRVYKRVTLSSHMTYLKPVVGGVMVSDIDQELLFNSRALATQRGDIANIAKATTSVLLTIALPEISSTNQEELDLLKLPQGLWTVMVVNCHERLTRDMEREPTQYLTPLAQFIRGITCSLRTQILNAEAIYEQLKERLRTSDDGSLFDDEQYSKSNLYHWTVKTCDELTQSLMASQRYITRELDRKVTILCDQDAHESERDGLLFWKAELETEVHALEELISLVAALNSSVHESRNALHGVTAVLEARVALQQGERSKVLAYLAAIYLPLTATSSLYNMSVLPDSATFWSFFVVLLAFMLGTALVAFSLKPIVTGVRGRLRIATQDNMPKKRFPPWFRKILDIFLILYRKTGLQDYIHYYLDIIKPRREGPFRWSHVFQYSYESDSSWDIILFLVFILPFLLVRTWPKALVREALTREVMFLRDQYYLHHSLKRNMPDLYWSPLALVRDFFRVLFLPGWCVLIVVIVGLLVLEDLIFFLLKALYYPLQFIGRAVTRSKSTD